MQPKLGRNCETFIEETSFSCLTMGDVKVNPMWFKTLSLMDNKPFAQTIGCASPTFLGKHLTSIHFLKGGPDLKTN